MTRVITIDDEKDSRSAIINMLESYCKDIEIVGEAANVAEGIKLIERVKPDVVFLDIRMPDGTGFDLLEKIPKIDFQVIFVTAYDQYALRAIKFSALDYLLKPIDPQQLVDAVSKIKKKPYSIDDINKKINILLRNKNGIERITLPTFEGLRFVNIKDIVRCEAESNYTKFFLITEDSILVTRTLKEFEEAFSDLDFIRVHQSHLVNTKYVDRYIKGDGGSIVMVDGSEVEVSRRRKDDFLKAMAGEG